jgi:hypothetical protein
MTNHPNSVDDFLHWLSVNIFGEDVVDNTKPSQYYPQANALYYPRHENLPFHPQSTYIPQDLNYQTQQTPTFTPPHHPQYASSSHEITEESPSQVPIAPSSAAETPTSSVPPSPKMFHKKCVCHILCLTIKAGIKTQCVNALIVNFKNSLHHIFSNNIRK